MALAVGVDVGGTKILSGLIDDAGVVHDVDRRPTPDSGDAIVAAIVEAVTDLCEDGDCSRLPVGCGYPGLVTHDGVARYGPNIELKEYALREHLVEQLGGEQVVVTNDARAATWGEFRIGAGRDVAETMVMITLGTGIGGGLIIGGRLHLGTNGFAGEVGHMVIEVGGEPGKSGVDGEIEAYASGSAMARMAATAHADGVFVGSSLDGPYAPSGEAVTEAALAGVEPAIAILAEAGRYLGISAAALVNVLDPELIVVGGGAAGAGAFRAGPGPSVSRATCPRRPAPAGRAHGRRHPGCAGRHDRCRAAGPRVGSTPVRTFVAFARPHTIIGTVMAVVALWAMAGATGGESVLSVGFGALVLAVLAALATNVYIVGINQLTDVAIDRINKPYLPLAAGAITLSRGQLWVVASGAFAVVAAAIAGPWLLAAVVIGLVVGTAYSVEPFRLKRFHLAAAAAITSVRALAVNLLVYAHFHGLITGRASIPRHIWALTGMVLGLTIAIAWFKDIPDADGDARHGIGTLVLRVGLARVLAVGLAVLSACYLSLIVAGVVGLDGVNGALLAAGHVVLLIALGVIVRQIDAEDPATLKRFYSRIWLLFFAEYVAFPLAVLLA